jgi:hypothetical protein
MPNASANPPPVIDCAQRLAFAVSDSSVAYTGRCGMIVGGKALGPVSHFAVCRDLGEQSILLLYCTDQWESVAAAEYPSVEDAKLALERAYAGISAKWVDSPSSESEVRAYLDAHWPDMCSFCGRRAFEVETLFKGKGAWICDQCVSSFGVHRPHAT